MRPSREDATQRGLNRNCLKGQVALLIRQDWLRRKKKHNRTKWAERGYCWLILFTVETVAAFSANFPEASCASNADTKFQVW